MLGELELPPDARLKVYKTSQMTKPYDLITLVDIPKGTAGTLFAV